MFGSYGVYWRFTKNDYCLLEDVVYNSETEEDSYTWPSDKCFGKYFDKG